MSTAGSVTRSSRFPATKGSLGDVPTRPGPAARFDHRAEPSRAVRPPGLARGVRATGCRLRRLRRLPQGARRPHVSGDRWDPRPEVQAAATDPRNTLVRLGVRLLLAPD